MPSASTKKLDKGKEKVTVEDNKGKHGTKKKFEFIDLENENEERTTNMLLQSKDAQIRELQKNLGMEKYVINYYKVENKN